MAGKEGGHAWSCGRDALGCAGGAARGVSTSRQGTRGRAWQEEGVEGKAAAVAAVTCLDDFPSEQ